jgi:prenyltransferase/squalene oxidase-like repeat protein
MSAEPRSGPNPPPENSNNRPAVSRRHVIWGGVSALLAAARTCAGGQGAKEQAQEASSTSQIDPETRVAVQKGLLWLASRQAADGGFGSAHAYARNVGVCALCGFAFLSYESRRHFRAQIAGCTDYLLARAQPGGFIVEDEVVTHAPLYGHGFATSYLGQVYGEDGRAAVRDTLKRAASLLVSSQNVEGGWRYTSLPHDEDVSVTSCQVMALISARQAGVAVPRSVVERSLDFLRRCQNADGGFRYRLMDPPDSLFPRSAAVVVALHAAGLRDDEAVRRGRNYLQSCSLTPSIAAVHAAEYYYYGRLHATHAARQSGGAVWKGWYPQVCDELLKRQSAAGSWEDLNIGNEYATAMALIILQFPESGIPLFSL